MADVEGEANPQLENGYTRIANELLEALSRTNFSSYQRRVLDAILRKTYGYGKKVDRISTSQIWLMTGIHKANASRALKELIQRKIVIPRDNSKKIGINKNYNDWKDLTFSHSGKKKLSHGTTVIPRDNKRLSQGTPQKKRKKKHIYPQGFLTFWEAYPNGNAKKAAYKAWQKLERTEDMETLQVVILDALEKQKQAKELKKARGEFVTEWPYASTWLNGCRWEDEIQLKETQDAWAHIPQ